MATKKKTTTAPQGEEVVDKGTNTTTPPPTPPHRRGENEVDDETTSQEKELQDSVDKQSEEVGKFAKEAEALFEHVRVDTLWFASDGIAFFTEYDAKNHAVGLEDKEVVEVKRK